MTGSKARHMDQLLDKLGDGLNAETIADSVKEAYGIDLRQVSLLPEVLPAEAAATAAENNGVEALRHAWEQGGAPAEGQAIRGMINKWFGVNLDAISALDGKGISLFSKGQWIVRSPDDWIELHTGEGDRDVSIAATPRWRELHGDAGLPPALAEALVQLGYRAGPDGNQFSYARHDGTAVPDAFKGATIAAIMNGLILQLPST
ncbi:hypothetical protein ACX93W_13320 [Paenibacillus sp. CAU 1782]